VTIPGNQAGQTINVSSEHQRLVEKFEQLTQKFEQFVSRIEDNEPLLNKKSKGKKLLNKRNVKKSSLQSQINIEAEKRLKEFLGLHHDFPNQRSSCQSENLMETRATSHNRATASEPPRFEPQPGTSRDRFDNERFHQFQSHSSRQSDCWTEDRDREARELQVTKTVFIRRIDCLLNANPIDQIEDKQSEDECIQAYYRLFAHNGQMNSLFTNSISYEEFR
jgi:hypothetical protein